MPSTAVDGSVLVKGFGCRPLPNGSARTGRPALGTLQGRKPRDGYVGEWRSPSMQISMRAALSKPWLFPYRAPMVRAHIRIVKILAPYPNTRNQVYSFCL
jgi:hypothetical protein